VDRELALIKVSTAGNKRIEVLQLVEVFHGEIIDVGADSVTAELTAQPQQLDALITVLRPYGIKEMVRTGVVAMVRGG
jgi:acetolactate synthase-1/3 small subunit